MRKLLVAILSIALIAAGSSAQMLTVGSKPVASAPVNNIMLKQCVNDGGIHASSSTINISPTNGNTLTAFADSESNTTISVADQGSNAFTGDGTGVINPPSVSFIYLRMFHLSSVSGVTSVTFTFGTTVYGVDFVCETSGEAASPADVFDAVGGHSTLTAPWNTGPITTLNKSDIVWGLVADYSGNITLGCTSPWVLPTNGQVVSATVNDATICYQLVTSTGTYMPTGTVSPAATTGAIAGSYKSQ